MHQSLEYSTYQTHTCTSTVHCPDCARPTQASSVFGTPLTASSPCNALVCAKCIIMWLTSSGSTWCQCCHLEKPMSPSEVKCAPELILLLLSGVMAHCVASTFEVDLPTRSEMHLAVDVAVLLVDECLLQVPTGGTVRFVNRLFFFIVNSIFQHEDLAYLGSMQSSACSTSTTPYQYHTMHE